MKLKIKFTIAVLAMTLLAMAGTAEAAFLSSTAWLDMASLTWVTASGEARLIWGSENHNAESQPVILAARPQTRVKAA